MATADEYAEWIVKNSDKRGTPEFDTVAQAYQMARDEAPKSALKPKQAASWGELPGNIIPSAGRLVGGIAQTLMSPMQAIGGAMDAAAGGLRNAMPESVRSFVDRANTPDMQQSAERASNTGTAVGQFYKDRYGGLGNLKQTVIEDPVGAVADLSTVLGIGGAVAPGRTGGALSRASNLTNPLNAVKPLVQSAGWAGKQVLGLTTSQGPENVAQAAKSGFLGDRSFLDNLVGQESKTAVLSEAKDALQNMRASRLSDYKSNITATAADTTKLKFDSVDTALANVIDSMKEPASGKWKIGKAEVAKLKELQNVVKEWRIDPRTHTTIGLDALKQRLDALYPDSPMHNQAQRAITSVRNAVKDTIVDQSPAYAKTMSAYEEALRLEKEIERALSLGNKAAQDTALRKLQSLSRNNVNANYGHRLDLAKSLEDKGGVSLLPALAGQSMNTWQPRGLGGQLGMGAIGVTSFGSMNPWMLGALPVMSPKVVGGGLYAGGRAAGLLGSGAKAVGVTPQRALLGGLLADELAQFDNASQ